MKCGKHKEDVVRFLEELLGTNYSHNCPPSSASRHDNATSLLKADNNLSELLVGDMLGHEVGKDVYAFVTPFIVLIGLIGNVLSLCVFTSRHLRKLSASLYLIALSAADTIVLLTYVLLEWLINGLPRWPGGKSVEVINVEGVCQLFLFISYTFRFISVYLIVVFTIERYIAVCHPLHRRHICTRTFAKRIILSVHMLAAVLSLYKPLISGVHPHMKSYEKVRFNGLNSSQSEYVPSHHYGINETYSLNEVTSDTIHICGTLEDFIDINTTLELIYGLTITIVPFVIITILNILILQKLMNGETLNNNSMPRSRLRVELTITLMAISTAFIILNLPYFCVWLKLYLSDDPHAKTDVNTRNYFYISRSIFIINYSINFFVYCMTGSYYRGVIKKMMGFSDTAGYIPAMPSDITSKTDLKDSRQTPPSDLPSLKNDFTIQTTRL